MMKATTKKTPAKKTTKVPAKKSVASTKKELSEPKTAESTESEIPQVELPASEEQRSAEKAMPTPAYKEKAEDIPLKKGVEFHGFIFSSTPIEEAIFAHIVKRIDQIQFPKLFYSHIRGAVHSWISGTAIDDVILKLLTNDIMERTDYKGRPALQFKNRELRKYPVKSRHFAGKRLEE